MMTTRWQSVLCLGEGKRVGTQLGLMWLIPWCIIYPSPLTDRRMWKHYLPQTSFAGGNGRYMSIFHCCLFTEKVDCAHEQTDAKDVSDRFQSVPFTREHSRFTYCRSCLVPGYWNFFDNFFFTRRVWWNFRDENVVSDIYDLSLSVVGTNRMNLW